MRYYIFLLLILICNPSNAQVYHYKTGELIPKARAGNLITKKGVFSGYDAEFSTFVVPENRRITGTKLINIPVIKILALDTAVLEPVFILNGGPGTSNIWKRNFPEYLLKKHDIIMVGYRGVDGSEVLSCPLIKEMIKSENIFETENINKLYDAWYIEAERFRLSNIDIDAYDMYEVVRDIEEARIALGYNKINFYSFSYGTMLVQLYMSYFEENVNKLVMLGARPYGFYLHDPNLINKKLLQLFNNIYGNTRDSVFFESTIDSLFNDDNIFNGVNNVEITKFKISLFQMLYSYNSSLYLIQSLVDCSANNLDEIRFIYQGYNLYFNKDITLGDYALKTNCSAGEYIDTSYYFPKDNNKFNAGHYFTQGINTWYLSFNICRSNLSIDYIPKIFENKSLFISGKYDFIAPFELVQKDILPYFPNNEFILIENEGHEDLIELQSEEFKKKISEFLN